MNELSLGKKPEDGNIFRIWQDVMKSEADAVRASESGIYINGELTKLAADEYRPTNFLWAEFSTDKADYVVSIMGQRPPGCDNGANSASATDIHSTCPARLTTLPKDGTPASTVEMPGACAIWPSTLVEPQEKTGTLASLTSGALSLEAIQLGNTLPGCTVTFELK